MSAAEHDPRRQELLAKAAEVLAHAEPPPADAALRARQIRVALAGATVAPRVRPFGWWALALSGVAAALLVALGVLLTGPGTRGSVDGAVVLSGTVSSPRVTYARGDRLALEAQLHVPAGQRAAIRLDEGSQLQLAGGSSVRLTRRRGWSIVLGAGRTRVHAARQAVGASLRVRTPEALTRVVGTRFEVVRDARRGTTVRVSEVQVEVTPRAEADRHRVAGPDGVLVVGLDGKVRRPATRPAASRPLADSGPPDAAGRTDAGVDASSGEPARPAVSQIRRQIRGGRISRARALIQRGRRAGQGRRRYLAELAIVEAEADLAEKRFQRAIQGYLAVSRRYRGTPQAEAALFAACQLALDHDRARARPLLHRYQRRYPAGRFAKDAARLLQLLQDAR